MITCKKCGKELDDNQKFCPGCGLKVSDDPETPIDFKKAARDFTEKITPKGNLSSTPVINDFRQKLSAPMFLVFLCLYSILTLAVLINVRSMNLWGFSEILKLYDNGFSAASSIMGLGNLNLGLANSVETYLQNSWLGKIVILVKLALFIPYGITFYGLWDFFLSCRNPNVKDVSLKGIKLIDRLYMILKKVIIVVGIVLEIVFLVIAISAMSRYRSGAETLIINLFLAVYFGLNVFFFDQIRKILGKIIETVSSGVFTEQNKIPKSIFVYLVLVSVGYVFGSGGWFVSIIGISALVVLVINLHQYNTFMTGKYLNKS